MNEFYAAVGPFYDDDGATHPLGGVGTAELVQRRERWEVLAMQTQDGTWLYPAWQFAGDGTVHEVLRVVLQVMRGVDPWVAGVWLVNAHPDLENASPRQALAAGVAPEVVAAIAQHDINVLNN